MRGVDGICVASLKVDAYRALPELLKLDALPAYLLEQRAQFQGTWGCTHTRFDHRGPFSL